MNTNTIGNTALNFSVFGEWYNRLDPSLQAKIKALPKACSDRVERLSTSFNPQLTSTALSLDGLLSEAEMFTVFRNIADTTGRGIYDGGDAVSDNEI